MSLHEKGLQTAVVRMARLMARLRGPDGCPWDRAQTFATVAPYTIEEAYEVADAIAQDDMNALRDELGDLQLQVVFHARMAEERGAFDLAAVMNGMVDKMERRHPEIFGDAEGHATAGAKAASWDALKAAEKPAGSSALDGVALALPALMRAEKLQKRAARLGFDWPDVAGARAKVLEELAELDDAVDSHDAHEEAGDLLFAVVNVLRKRGIDPEVALRDANMKFERRFRAMQAAAGDGFEALPLDAKEALWQQAKRLSSGSATAEDRSASR